MLSIQFPAQLPISTRFVYLTLSSCPFRYSWMVYLDKIRTKELTFEDISELSPKSENADTLTVSSFMLINVFRALAFAIVLN